MSCQIPAIHRGDVTRLERVQVARVVPIVEMAFEALELFHRRQCRFDAFDCFVRADPAEVARTRHGKQVKAEIGRRCPMRQDRFGVFLKIIGRQHVVRCRHESLEIPPSSPRNQTQRIAVRLRDFHTAGYQRRNAGPQCNGGRGQPGEDKRRGHRPSATSEEPYDARSADRDSGGTGHLPHKARQSKPRTQIGAGRGHPFEQIAVAHKQPEQCPPDGIHHRACLEGKECDDKSDLR